MFQILKEIKDNEINIYEFPDIEDEEENSASKKLAVSIQESETELHKPIAARMLYHVVH